MKIERLILLTDLSPCSRKAYPIACEIARRHQAELTLLHSLAFPVNYAFTDPMSTQVAIDDIKKGIVDSMKKELELPVFANVSVESKVIEGYGPEVVSEYAKDTGQDLIVQSSHGYKGFKRFVLGSFAERILHLSTVPVLTIKESDAEESLQGFRPKHILFPHDLTDLSTSTSDAVKFLVGCSGAKVTVLHSIPTWPEWPEAPRANLIENATEKLNRIVAKELDGLDVEIKVLEGEPTDIILEYAKEADVDLVCMATHSWSFFHHLLMGSVAEKIAREVQTPILTVQPSEEAVEKVKGLSTVREILI